MELKYKMRIDIKTYCNKINDKVPFSIIYITKGCKSCRIDHFKIIYN